MMDGNCNDTTAPLITKKKKMKNKSHCVCHELKLHNNYHLLWTKTDHCVSTYMFGQTCLIKKIKMLFRIYFYFVQNIWNFIQTYLFQCIWHMIYWVLNLILKILYTPNFTFWLLIDYFLDCNILDMSCIYSTINLYQCTESRLTFAFEII